MARELTAIAQAQITTKRVNHDTIFKINSVDRTVFLIDYNYSYNVSFGSATCTVTVQNTGGIFGKDGAYEIKIGDIIEISEVYSGDSVEYKKFYGVVEQRSKSKTANDRTIVLNCLDYISLLQKLDLDLTVEGTRVKIEEEVLVPNYLPSPNNALAQVFNFANNSIAQEPSPVLTIRPKNSSSLVGESPQYDGFTIKYANGQVQLGTPLNALDNYDLIAVSYYFYTEGVYAEDVIEEILTQPDGYGKYLFGETNAQAIIDNHLTDTFLNVEGTSTDYLVPNYSSSEITIKTQLSEDYDPDASGDPTVINVLDTSGFPTSGTGSINGDSFTWTGKTSTTLTGVSGLIAHPSESFVEYEFNYATGTVWYLTYSNLIDDLDTNDFSGIPSGVTVEYVDKRNGRIILSEAISISTILSYTSDYNFKTLQSSGITLNKIRFNKREVANRFEAINKVRDYLAPNYIIRTRGDNKIWSSYLSQRVAPDYTLSLATSLNYLEDEDLYTRVVFYGRNQNPTNIMFNEGVQFVDSGQEFKGTASQDELTYDGDEGNYRIFKTSLPNAGRIDPTNLKPIVYINNVPVNDKTNLIQQMPVVVQVKNRIETITEQNISRTNVTTRQYFYYKVRFAHASIDPTKDIRIYNNVGELIITISAGDGNMNYGDGIYNVPGTDQNGTVEQASTATYNVFYSSAGIDIDYANVKFKLSKQLVPFTDFVVVAASYQYWTAITPFDSIGSVIDGRYDTQTQTIFYAEPPAGLPYAILDLGAVYEIQAFDIVAGFYQPDDVRKFDVDFTFSMEYSEDNLTYHPISAEATNIHVTSGKSISLEEDKLGTGFSTRYLLIKLDDVKKIEYGAKGTWPVAFTEAAAYTDIILKSEAKLIPTTYLIEDITTGSGTTSFTVNDASAFTFPESGETITAYIGDDQFTYTGIESGNTFVGVEGISADHYLGDRVTQSLEDDSSFYDVEFLLPDLGDRLFKEIKINDQILYTQDRLDRLAKAWLAEFYKDHTKISVDVLFCPHLEVGHTVRVIDTYENIDQNYFIESVTSRNGSSTLVLARYPE